MRLPRSLTLWCLLAASLTIAAAAACSADPAGADAQPVQIDSGTIDLPAPPDQGGQLASDAALQPDAPGWGECTAEDLAPFVLDERYCLVARAPLTTTAVSANHSAAQYANFPNLDSPLIVFLLTSIPAPHRRES